MSFQQWDATAKQPHTLFTVTGGRIDAQTQPQNALKLTLDVMFDVRYNPFERAALENEEGNWGRFERWLNFAYIPVKLELLNDSGAVVAHYMETVGAEDYKPSGSGWQPGAAAWGDFRLSYYDWTDRKSKTGMGGWATNKTTIDVRLCKKFLAVASVHRSTVLNTYCFSSSFIVHSSDCLTDSATNFFCLI